MQRRPDINLPTAVAIAVFLVCATASVHGVADTGASRQDQDRALLQRMYNIRMQHEQERANRDNEAKANIRLVTQSGAVDTPTVSGLRSATSAQLARFESQFECLDVDVENNGGNTVVICGGNSGDISGSNVSAGHDIVTLPGGAP